MTAQEQMKKILDELMGTSRDGKFKSRQKMHFNNAYFSICLGCWNFEFYENTRVPGDYKVRKTKERDSFGINEYILQILQ